MKQALNGLKVVEYGDFISAPYCAKLMADLGAEVIKVEPLNGDRSRRNGPSPDNVPDPEQSGLFIHCNTNKLGVTLNIETTTGREIFKTLIKDADIFIENMLPQRSKKLHIDYDSLRQINPQLIEVSITAFGQTGKYQNHKGYAINSSAFGGLSHLIGESGRPPITYPLSVGHYQSGTIAAFSALSAVLTRKRLKKGQHIDISEADCWATYYAAHTISSFVFHQQKRMRTGHRIPGFYPYTMLPCKDGYMCMIAVQGFQWKRFLELIGGGEVPDWYKTDPRFKDRWAMGREHAEALDASLAPWLMSHTKEEIFTLCRKARVPFAPVRTIEEVAHEPHFQERDYFVDACRKDAGSTKCPGPPYRFSKTPWEVKRLAPSLGEHNEEVLCHRLGYLKQDLADLRRGGII